jgi:hypothetical protein
LTISFKLAKHSAPAKALPDQLKAFRSLKFSGETVTSISLEGCFLEFKVKKFRKFKMSPENCPIRLLI